MSALLAWINAVPKDRWIHYAGSVVLFALFRHLLLLIPTTHITGIVLLALTYVRPTAAILATLAHVVKKVRDYVKGSRDWSDLTQDTLFGAAGALNALLCGI